MNYTEIKTFENACDKMGYDAKTAIPQFDLFPKEHQKAMQAHAKLIIIAEALNDGWKPNWNDWDEYKYYPWFEMGSSSGSGFRFFVYVGWDARSIVGSRLCFKSRDIAKYAGKQFEGLYRDYYVIE